MVFKVLHVCWGRGMSPTAKWVAGVLFTPASRGSGSSSKISTRPVNSCGGYSSMGGRVLVLFVCVARKDAQVLTSAKELRLSNGSAYSTIGHVDKGLGPRRNRVHQLHGDPGLYGSPAGSARGSRWRRQAGRTCMISKEAWPSPDPCTCSTSVGTGVCWAAAKLATRSASRKQGLATMAAPADLFSRGVLNFSYCCSPPRSRLRLGILLATFNSEAKIMGRSWIGTHLFKK